MKSVTLSQILNLGLGLGLANVIYCLVQSKGLSLAIERSFFQWIALLILWLQARPVPAAGTIQPSRASEPGTPGPPSPSS